MFIDRPGGAPYYDVEVKKLPADVGDKPKNE